MRITVIIPVRNNKADTLDCLQSLERSLRPQDDVIVINNGSTDGTVEAVVNSFPKMLILSNSKNQSYSASVNQGASIAFFSSDAVLILNNDTVVSPDLLNRLEQTLEDNPRLGAVSPKILYFSKQKIWYAGGDLKLSLGMIYHRGLDKPADTIIGGLCDWATGCCMLVKKECFQSAGGFDTDYFYYGEDVDFCLRAKREGWLFSCVTEAVILHKISRSSTTWKKFRMKLAGELRLIWRHNSIWIFPLAFAGFVLYNLFRLSKKLFK